MSSSMLRGALRFSSSSTCSTPFTRNHLNFTCAIRHPGHSSGALNTVKARCLFTRTKPKKETFRMASASKSLMIGFTTIIITAGITYILYRSDELQPLPATKLKAQLRADREKFEARERKIEKTAEINKDYLATLPFQNDKLASNTSTDSSAWGNFTQNFALFAFPEVEWATISDSIADFVLPEWAKVLPAYIRKLQNELSMAPGSLADQIWEEAHDPDINPEIEYSASVRVSNDLCKEEKQFLAQRKKFTTAALAKYLDIPEADINPDDVPTIAMVGSGGGLRALVAGTGSMLAAEKDGLFDCVTYTAGVSGSCWLQALYHSSLGGRSFSKMVQHLKARLGVHIAYPPTALAALNSAPTNKYLLSGFVEKLKGDPTSDFGLVDVYGLLLAARLLVPKGEVGVNDADLKISNQRTFIKDGEHPMPIYTAVRHEIPIIEESSEIEKATDSPSEETKIKAKREAWFQWFEITPFEMACEEIGAGIPTWAIGRKFEKGRDIPFNEDGLRVPELRLPLMLGVFGSAFCATLSHYYAEVRPLVKGLTGFGGVDDMIEGRNDDLSKVHPIDPASIPNFAYKMDGKLPETTPESMYTATHLKLMDAGMSNNLPIYPLLRPGRDVDILIAFDASADIKVQNWLSVADGYALQRGIKGWPIGSGWPKANSSTEKTAGQLEDAQAKTAEAADAKIEDAKREQVEHLKDLNEQGSSATTAVQEDAGDLGYCTVWCGTTEERSSDIEHVQSKAVQEDWELMNPDAGIAVVYFPFLSNPKVPNVEPTTSEYMSTWNFVYTPENVDQVVALARANYEEGKEQTRRTVRAVYERKKKQRQDRESAEKEQRWRRKVRLGIVGKKGEGDHFHLT